MLTKLCTKSWVTQSHYCSVGTGLLFSVQPGLFSYRPTSPFLYGPSPLPLRRN